MEFPAAALLCALCCGLLAPAARAGYSEERCSWRGSGLTQEPGSVGQLALACAEGAVEWLYPAGALRLTLGGPDPRARPGIACLRPVRPFAGAQVFAERAGGALELLLAEGPGPAGGRCVRWGPRERRALFLQATPHRDISRRVAAFRFELREDGRPELPPQAHGLGVDGVAEGVHTCCVALWDPQVPSGPERGLCSFACCLLLPVRTRDGAWGAAGRGQGLSSPPPLQARCLQALQRC
ncbi:meteorin isoform X3 [Gorilla gorilla gorilla]|uniref:meteorin isoform X3 n=1 Tax=Gorilla gorilla gorilla TaxID=9595 RepID=UPI003008229C